MKRRLLLVVGTRPEVIKLAPVARVLARRGRRPVLAGTGQHRALLDQMLETFGLELDHDLDLMRRGQTPGDVLSAALPKLKEVFAAERPSIVVVQGDTTTALAAALAAFNMGIPVAHVEAGVRSRDLSQPYPEEANRVIIDRVARLHFAATRENRKNLLREGIPSRGIRVTGNTVVDSLRWMLKRQHAWGDKKLERFLAAREGRPKALLTIHRRESFGAPLKRVLGAVKLLVEKVPGLCVVFPAHLNPAVLGPARALKHPDILVSRPLSYPDFVRTAGRCDVILSDSGGVQEEAPTLGVPVVVLRAVSDRPEAVKAGLAVLAGTSPALIVRGTMSVLRDASAFRRSLRAHRDLFGDGKAAERIAEVLSSGAL